MTHRDFAVIHSEHGARWLHKSGTMFISFSPVTNVRGAHFQAYAAKDKVPAGRDPWTVDNKRLGRDGYGFPTFEAAAAAVAEATV